jgi:hypothetical protein
MFHCHQPRVPHIWLVLARCGLNKPRPALFALPEIYRLTGVNSHISPKEDETWGTLGLWHETSHRQVAGWGYRASFELEPFAAAAAVVV